VWGQGSRHEKYRVAASSTTFVDRSIRIIELQDIEKPSSNEPESTAMNKRIFSRLDALQKVVTET
jgi:hypothetical protein